MALSLALPESAWAHAELVSSDPPANASLTDAPAGLTLTFSEPIDAASASVRLLDERQADVAGLGDLDLDDEGRVAHVTVPGLEPGTYTVSYQVTSAVDGHVTAGRFAFLVDPTGTEPAPALGTQRTSLSSDPAAVAARWLALAGALALAGTLLFWIFSAAPALRAAHRPAAAPWGAAAGAAALAFAALALYLALAARPLVEAGTHHRGVFALDFAAPFGWTPFAIAMRVALLGAFAAFAVAAGRWVAHDEATRRGRPAPAAELAWLVFALVAALVSLAGMSGAGHAAAAGGPLFAALDLLHLVGVAAWLGALVGLILLLRRARSAAGPALRRHSRVALAAAPVVVLTGIANSPLVLGASPRELVASDYGNLLLAKALLFSLGVGIGAANHLLVRRRSARGWLPLIGAELLVGAVAVLVAAGMVTGRPAATRAPALTASAIGVAHLYGTAGGSSVHAAVNLPAPGQQRYQVSVTDVRTGAPRTAVQRVILSFTPPPDSDLAPERVPLQAAEQPGLWGTSGAYTPVIGTWELEVIVRRRGELDESATFPLPVTLPLPPQPVPPPDTGVGVPLPLAALWSFLPAGMAGWGLLLAALALVAVTFALARRRPSPSLSLLRAGLVAVTVMAGVGLASRAAVDAANRPPTQAAARPNPLPASAESIDRGRVLYLANCAVCHGRDGSGDGPAASGMLPAPAPLSEVVPRLSDGAIAYRIAVGTAGTRMPPFAATLSENDRWDIVNYLRAEWPGR